MVSFSSRSVNLSWTGPGGEMVPVSEYEVKVRRGENTSWADSQEVRTNSSLTTFTVTGLQPFTVYSFRVVAVLDSGVKGESEESYYMVTLRELPTGSPTITTAHNITSTALYLAWQPPHPLTIHGEFLGYRLSFQPSQAGHREGRKSIVMKSPDIQEYILRDLKTYTKYNVAIQVINPEGAGPAAKVTVMTDEGVPSAPMYTTVHTVTNTTAVVDWSRPQQPNGVILGYRLYFLSGNLTEVKTIRSKDPRLDFRLTDLSPSSLYHVWIKAFTWKNEGLSSSKLSIRTDVRSPPVPEISNISCHSDNRIRVEWSPCTSSQSPARCVYTLRIVPASNPAITLTLNQTEEVEGEVVLTSPELGETEEEVVLSVRAGSVSMYKSDLAYWSPWSDPVQVQLQDCSLRQGQQQSDSTDLSSSPDTSALTTAVIAGIVLASVLMLLLLGSLLVWRLYCRESYYYLEESGTSPNQTSSTAWETDTNTRLTAEQFLAQVKNLHLEDDKEFVVEFRNMNNTRSVQGNGSYEQQFCVDGYNQPKAYLVTPLPLNYKFNFFWKQIWEHKVEMIVMLENIVEQGAVLWDQYWPDTRALYGQVEVSLSRTEKFANFTVRTFLVSHLSVGRKGDSRRVTQLQFTSWPVKGHPANPLPLLTFIKLSIKQQEMTAGPVVVHSNSTNSRAGLFITLFSLLKQIRTTGHVNLKAFLREAPQKNQSLVRTVKDFIYIHDVMVEYIVAGETNIKNSYMSRYINSLQCSMDQTSLLHRQTDLINVDFVKRDRSLEMEREMIWLPGHHSQYALLLMRYPQDNDIPQFWRLVLEHSVTTIVVLKSVQKTSFPDLVLTEDCGLLQVTHRDDEISYEFKSKNFIIQYGATVRKCVKVIFSEHFMSDTEPLQDSLKLLETVNNRQNSLNKTAPVLVLDTNTTGDTGAIFCSLISLLQQHQAEQHCDVYQAVKTVNLARRGVWTSQEKLLRMYKLVEVMILGNNTDHHNNNLSFQNKKSQFRISINGWKNKSKAGVLPAPTPCIVNNDTGWF